jgi:hypothetical protein
MNKICIIFPYFGKLPPQFKFWWQSALKNPTIDFMIFTDNQSILSEENIYVQYLSFEECRLLVQKQFSFPINLNSPYKLCDYKPAYGSIFYEYIKDFDFWGFGDIDLIYGDIRLFYTNEILEKYEVISGWGHLSLYKNTEFWRNFYKKDIEGFQKYETVYSNNENFGFDEYWHGGQADKVQALYPEKIYRNIFFDDLRIPIINLLFQSELQPMYKSYHLIFEYENGNLYRIYNIGYKVVKEPIIYVHYKRRQKMIKIQTEQLNHYLIIPNRIIPYEEITLDKLLKWTSCSRIKQLVFTFSCRVVNRLRRYALQFKTL